MLEDYPDIAQSDQEAARRFELAKRDDPFPEIVPSLLSSADIYDYIRMTGILYPFRVDKLKSASYEANIGGKCIWWDAKGSRQEITLGSDHPEFRLAPNSIAFVQVEPMFRLPDYIALRFNLKITHVHRGILLGTGPLVDPGFVGRLLIPLHNLTTNEYRLAVGDGLIWIEFTKSSTLPTAWAGSASPGMRFTRRGTYAPFPEDKKDLEPDRYLAKAAPNTPIRSSIPEAVRGGLDAARQAAASAEEARSRAEGASDTVRRYSIAALIVFLVTLGGFVYTTWQLIQSSWGLVDSVRKDLLEETTKREEQVRLLKDMEREIRRLGERLEQVAAESRKSPKGAPSK